MNSREKGKRGERQWRDELRAEGYAARRGQQFAGGVDSPDVVCPALPWAHFEVKLTERLDLYAAMAQARRDGCGRAAFVAHRRNYWPWLVTMDAERFYRLLQVDMTGDWAEQMACGAPAAALGAFDWLRCEVREGRSLNIHEAMVEARLNLDKAEGGRLKAEIPIVAHRRVAAPPANSREWLITMEAEGFFRLLRGDFSQQGNEGNEEKSPWGK